MIKAIKIMMIIEQNDEKNEKLWNIASVSLREGCTNPFTFTKFLKPMFGRAFRAAGKGMRGASSSSSGAKRSFNFGTSSMPKTRANASTRSNPKMERTADRANRNNVNMVIRAAAARLSSSAVAAMIGDLLALGEEGKKISLFRTF
jgi:hypothetical protein